jgi:hypothetical protein
VIDRLDVTGLAGARTAQLVGDAIKCCAVSRDPHGR